MKPPFVPRIPMQIVIGKYRICQIDDPRNIWIGREDKRLGGEGGVVKMRDLEEVIAKFYQENF